MESAHTPLPQLLSLVPIINNDVLNVANLQKRLLRKHWTGCNTQLNMADIPCHNASGSYILSVRWHLQRPFACPHLQVGGGSYIGAYCMNALEQKHSTACVRIQPSMQLPLLASCRGCRTFQDHNIVIRLFRLQKLESVCMTLNRQCFRAQSQPLQSTVASPLNCC